MVLPSSWLPAPAWSQDSPFITTPARHILRLSPDEYSIVHSAMTSGVTKYGGDAEVRLRLTRESGSLPPDTTSTPLVWNLTITQPRLIDVLQLWMAEKTAELVGVVDLDKLDPDTKLALRAVQSVNAKLAQAKNNPIWDLAVTPAVVGIKSQDTQPPPPTVIYTLSAGDEIVEAVGPAAASLKPLVGKRAIVKGHVKTAGHMELVSATPVQENTLELVTMSQCPYGIKAADALIEFLKSPGNLAAGATSPPQLSVRYLFYQKQEQTTDGKPKTVWWSLHGEPEVAENLVQIVIRDAFPDRFGDYLQKRAQGSSDKWQELARQVGLGQPEMDLIQNRIKDGREALIQAEYDYVSGILGVTDGSPTFVWESQIVNDIKKVPVFRPLDLNKGSCAGAADSK